MRSLEKQFEEKTLAIIGRGSIRINQVKSYAAYHIRGGQAFIRLYPNKITIALPFSRIPKNIIKRYNLQDNSNRYPRHELMTKGPPLSSTMLAFDFIKLVKEAFLWIKNRDRTKNYL